MGKYLCLDCGEVYDPLALNLNETYEYIKCPKTNCCGYLIEVDELMIPTIQILNKKGYATRFCCSGHYTGQHPNAYIMFEDWVDIPSVPEGFNKEDNENDCITIRSTLPFNQPSLEDFKSICDNAKILLDWAISLPDYEPEYY